MSKLKRKVNKETKAYKAKELRRLRNKCQKLWSHVVRRRAGNKCEYCSSMEYVHAHHVESYMVNQNLRFDLRNGVSLCALHHKFGKMSAHKSLCFMFTFMAENRREDFKYLLKIWNQPVKEITKEFLESKIDELQNFLENLT